MSNRLWQWFLRMLRRERSYLRGAGVSLLVPFRSDHGVRAEVWEWLIEYWANELPGAEIIVGTSDSVPFCKTEAVNAAASIAQGDIFVILDADCYIQGDVIQDCAQAIRDARAYHEKLWFVPYRKFWRLTREATAEILASDPAEPLWPSCPPDPSILDDEESESHGHWFGALIQIMPREAFWAVGGMDPRFRGWGGEDVSFMRALDCLYARHKTTSNGVFHLWHPKIQGDKPKQRFWQGQDHAKNGHLSTRYRDAMGDRSRMRRLVDEGFEWECDNR